MAGNHLGRRRLPNSNEATLSVIDGSTNTAIATVPVNSAYAVAVDPDTRTIYVTNYNESTLSVINGTTQEVIATVPVGTHPSAVAVDPSTHTVYVTNYADNTVSVIESR